MLGYVPTTLPAESPQVGHFRIIRIWPASLCMKREHAYQALFHCVLILFPHLANYFDGVFGERARDAAVILRRTTQNKFRFLPHL